MFDVFDTLVDDGTVKDVRPCIHYFRGVYCSGGHPEWPYCEIPGNIMKIYRNL